jgi:GrpB-like predicted nucleotidyltransferase (UPF0157 family)
VPASSRYRDYLRAHRDAAGEYASLKRDLAKKFEPDRDGYTAAKADFIRSVVSLARTSRVRAGRR